MEEDDRVIVTIWFRHLYEDRDQNKHNLILQGSLHNMISQCHPKAKYTEADLSDYNLNAYTFVEKANEWKVNLDILEHGPMIQVMFNDSGYQFWGLESTMEVDLLKAVDAYIRELEKPLYGDKAPDCVVSLDYSYLSKLDDLHASQDYPMFFPDADSDENATNTKANASKVQVSASESHIEKKPKIELQEPEKSQQGG